MKQTVVDVIGRVQPLSAVNFAHSYKGCAMYTLHLWEYHTLRAYLTELHDRDESDVVYHLALAKGFATVLEHMTGTRLDVPVERLPDALAKVHNSIDLM